ncbi:MAG: hypothetical protein M1336_01045 [Deltaproteobacteria bacterium]|nr:hypothetical protein [Deltaproteobacteria bacterium]
MSQATTAEPVAKRSGAASPALPAPALGHALNRLWSGWKRIARKLGDLQARLLLTVFYYVLLAPFALVLRWTSDPLAIKPGARTGWLTRPDNGTRNPLEAARQQY